MNTVSLRISRRLAPPPPSASYRTNCRWGEGAITITMTFLRSLFRPVPDLQGISSLILWAHVFWFCVVAPPPHTNSFCRVSAGLSVLTAVCKTVCCWAPLPASLQTQPPSEFRDSQGRVCQPVTTQGSAESREECADDRTLET